MQTSLNQRSRDVRADVERVELPDRQYVLDQSMAGHLIDVCQRVRPPTSMYHLQLSCLLAPGGPHLYVNYNGMWVLCKLYAVPCSPHRHYTRW